MYIPEPPAAPPEDKYIFVDCGCEVYTGEPVITWDEKELCPDHFRDAIKVFLDPDYPERLVELADMLGLDYRSVH